MISELRRLARRIGQPVLAPVRAQVYAWIDYRIRSGGIPEGESKRPWTVDPGDGPALPTFSVMAPALLNAISRSNAEARAGRRRELALEARVAALEERVVSLQATLGQAGLGETDPGKTDPAKTGAAKTRPGKVGPGKTGPGKTGTDEG